MYSFTEQNIFIFLIQIFLLLSLARGLGELFRRWKQPVLTAEILVGLILGPTVFARLLPGLYQIIFPPDIIQQNMLETIMWLGLLFFLLETGLKMDFSAAWRHRGNALKIALIDIIVPMIICFTLSLLIPSKYLVDPNRIIIFAVFMATVMTISAMTITTRALSDLNLLKTDLGYLIMSALSVNEIIGWLVFTLILGVFTKIYLNVGSIFVVFIATISFVFICLSLGRKFSNFVISTMKRHDMPEPGSSLTFICLLGMSCGAIFQKLGVNALLGFFIAGTMAGEARELPDKTRQVISQMVYAIFVPLFFAGIGLKLDFFRNFNLFLVLFVTIIGMSSKFIGAWIGVKFTTLSKSNRFSVAIAHIPGGSMEIVIGILALNYNLITEQVFVAIVFGGVFSCVIFGPLLKYSVTRRKEISILEFFSKKEVIAELEENERNSAIKRLCTVASEHRNMPGIEKLYSLTLARENMMSTAVEEGIAFPHARINSLIRPMIIFGRSISGIEWNSPDGKLAHFIFFILTPKEDDEAQIQILRIIAKIMSNGQIRDKIMNATSSHEIGDILHTLFTAENIVRK